MAKYQKTGVLSHINDYGAEYGDYLAVDFQEAQETLIAGQAMFDDLPSQARKHFDNDPAKFMEFVADPDNIPKLEELGLLRADYTAPNTDPVPTPAPTADNPTEDA